jgi:syntaxin-binding protein 1
VLNLFYMGVTLLQGAAGRKKKVERKRGAEGYDVSRFVAPLKRVLEDTLSGALSPTDYPYTRPPQGGGGGGGAVAKRPDARSLASDVPGRRLIVFVCGGLSYSELRAMHEVAAATGRDIIIGTTAMLTPKRFLLGLKNLKQLDLAGSSQRL